MFHITCTHNTLVRSHIMRFSTNYITQHMSHAHADARTQTYVMSVCVACHVPLYVGLFACPVCAALVWFVIDITPHLCITTSSQHHSITSPLHHVTKSSQHHIITSSHLTDTTSTPKDITFVYSQLSLVCQHTIALFSLFSLSIAPR